MKCPHCQAGLTESVAACPSCEFSFDRIGSTFGRMPTLKGSLSDMVSVLSSRQQARIRSSLKRFVREFPQLQFYVYLTSVASEHRLSEFAFWLFNGSGMCSTLQKGGLNFHNLLVVDVEHHRANLSIGYGLEPFISDEDLAKILDAGRDTLMGDEPGEAVLAMIDEARAVFHEKSAMIPRAFGMRMKMRDDASF